MNPIKSGSLQLNAATLRTAMYVYQERRIVRGFVLDGDGKHKAGGKLLHGEIALRANRWIHSRTIALEKVA